MAKRRSLSDSSCPVARALDIIGDRWSLLIVRDAFDNIRRFGEFQASLGIARNILASRLRMLEETGVMQAVPASDGSAYQDYVLTPRGESLFPVIVTLRQWGEGHLFARGEAHSVLIERVTGKPIPKQALRGSDGETLLPSQTRVKKFVAQAGAK